MKSQCGFSILELLVAVGISIPILAALTIAVRAETEAYRIARKRDARESDFFRAEELLQRAISDSDGASWLPSARIHRNGRINFVDGTANPVMSVALTNQPARFSDAITSTEIDLEHTFETLSGAMQGQTLSVTACPKYPSSREPRVAHSLLAVSSDGVFEVLASKRNVIFGSTCQKLRLRSTRSMLTASASDLDLLLTRSLVPILSVRTLYVDKKNNLRHLGHRGAENIENQPLLSGLKGLRLKYSTVPPWNLRAFAGTMRGAHEGVQDFSFIAALAHSGRHNFFLNRP